MKPKRISPNNLTDEDKSEATSEFPLSIVTGESNGLSDPDIIVEDGILVLRAKEPFDAAHIVSDDREDRMAFLSRSEQA